MLSRYTSRSFRTPSATLMYANACMCSCAIIDAVYGIKAYGEVARGDSLDYLTVRVSIGYDR